MKIELTQEQIKALAQGVVPNELKEQAEAALPKSRVPDSWKALKEISGHYIDSLGKIDDDRNVPSTSANKHIFATESQAKSALAAAQLSQLMKATNGAWVADWGNEEDKYCIYRCENDVSVETYWHTYSFLAFPTAELRDEFMTKHEALIKQYFEL